jgi:predicted phosphodiesterase
MRFAIVSDIHANMQAWTAVLRDISSNRVDGIICLGDVVGYGPNPLEALQSVQRHVDTLLLGNHDAALCGKLDPVLFNSRARAALDWTRTTLAEQANEFLAASPLVHVGYGFRCTHGEFSSPAAFRYIITAAEALPSWQATSEPLLFVGHTHLPGIFIIGASGTPNLIPPQDFMLETGKRYLINVGSVGFPRDNDPRACYVIYDTTEQSILWRRIPFDIAAYRQALVAAGLPPTSGSFRDHDPLATRSPIHTQLDFQPAARPGLASRAALLMAKMNAPQLIRVHRRKLPLLLLLLQTLLRNAADRAFTG